MLKLEKVTKIYHAGEETVTACDHIDLTIEDGELVAIMGPSGAGKSTLLHILGCLDGFDEGSYRIDDISVEQQTAGQLSAIRNRYFGFVLQEYGLVSNETVCDNVMIPLIFNPHVTLKQCRKLTSPALEKVGLKGYEQRKIATLSGGQKQRVAIARAIVNESKVILCDEPTGALDQKTSGEIMDLLLEINKTGKTVIIVTHDPKVAGRCDRLLRVVDGHLSETE